MTLGIRRQLCPMIRVTGSTPHITIRQFRECPDEIIQCLKIALRVLTARQEEQRDLCLRWIFRPGLLDFHSFIGGAQDIHRADTQLVDISRRHRVRVLVLARGVLLRKTKHLALLRQYGRIGLPRFQRERDLIIGIGILELAHLLNGALSKLGHLFSLRIGQKIALRPDSLRLGGQLQKVDLLGNLHLETDHVIKLIGTQDTRHGKHLPVDVRHRRAICLLEQGISREGDTLLTYEESVSDMLTLIILIGGHGQDRLFPLFHPFRRFRLSP